MTKDQRLQIRVSKEEREQIQQYGEFRKLSEASTVRFLIFAAMYADEEYQKWLESQAK